MLPVTIAVSISQLRIFKAEKQAWLMAALVYLSPNVMHFTSNTQLAGSGEAEHKSLGYLFDESY